MFAHYPSKGVESTTYKFSNNNKKIKLNYNQLIIIEKMNKTSFLTWIKWVINITWTWVYTYDMYMYITKYNCSYDLPISPSRLTDLEKLNLACSTNLGRHWANHKTQEN